VRRSAQILEPPHRNPAMPDRRSPNGLILSFREPLNGTTVIGRGAGSAGEGPRPFCRVSSKCDGILVCERRVYLATTRPTSDSAPVGLERSLSRRAPGASHGPTLTGRPASRAGVSDGLFNRQGNASLVPHLGHTDGRCAQL
jgi:hypothetical protein